MLQGESLLSAVNPRQTEPAGMCSYPPKNAAALSPGCQICFHSAAALLGITGLIYRVLNQ